MMISIGFTGDPGLRGPTPAKPASAPSGSGRNFPWLDTVAERLGTRLQSARRRFESARCFKRPSRVRAIGAYGRRALACALRGGASAPLHKIETLLAALRVFRAGIVAEFDEYDRRERELDEQRSA